METLFKTTLLFSLVCLCLSACRIKGPDFFVPEVSTTEDLNVPIAFLEDGGSVSVSVQANCEWTASCPANWVILSQEAGSKDAQLGITVSPSRLSRSTIVTVASDEVESRCIEFKITQKGVKEISKVAAPTASGIQSIHGDMATLLASYESLGLEEGDQVTAGFSVKGQGYDKEIDAVVNPESASFTASLNDLVNNTTYSCFAWARINGGAKVVSEESRFTTERINAELLGVGETTASNLSSEEGTTATLSSYYLATVQLDDLFDIQAGFTLTPENGESFEVFATVLNRSDGTFRADVTGLVKGMTYSVHAWTILEGNRKEGSESSFKTKKMLAPGTYAFTFTSNAWKVLPTKADGCKSDGPDKVYTITEDDFTWQICGGFIANNCLRLGSENKIGYYGWAILPQFNGLTATKIIVPNDGSGSSGTCCVSILVSEDGGSSWSVVPGCEARNIKSSNAAGWEFNLPDQKPGSLYKVQNVKGSVGHGNSMSTKITIVVE